MIIDGKGFLNRIHSGKKPTLASWGPAFDLGFINLLEYHERSDLFIDCCILLIDYRPKTSARDP